MAAFLFVHGAWHGGWCWDLVTRELRSAGHETVAVDLPIDDPSKGCSDYADAAVASLAGIDETVVVVGHSLGGLTIPLLPERRAVRQLVFLAPLIPEPGTSWRERSPDIGSRVDRSGLIAEPDSGVTRWTIDGAIDGIFDDVPRPLARWAAEQLRPQAPTPLLERCPLESIPDVPIDVVCGSYDRAMSAEWCRSASKRLLGVDAIQMPWGHSPFLTHPVELASLLVDLTTD